MTKKVNRNDNLPHGVIRIKSHLDSLKPAERKVATYILDNIGQVIHLSITKLAENAGVSEATVVKFCQRIGYSGYQELKIVLARASQQEQKGQIYGEIVADDELDSIVEKMFQIYDESLGNTRKLLLNSRMEEAVQMFLKARNIYFFGFGASGIVAEDAELKFKRINHHAEALTDNHSQMTIGALLGEEDLVIGISDSGKTRELIQSLEVVKGTGAKIIGITSNLGSPITDLSDIVLLTSSEETPFRGSALASRMAQLAVFDVLFLGVATAEYDQTQEALEKTRKVMRATRL